MLALDHLYLSMTHNECRVAGCEESIHHGHLSIAPHCAGVQGTGLSDVVEYFNSPLHLVPYRIKMCLILRDFESTVSLSWETKFLFQSLLFHVTILRTNNSLFWENNTDLPKMPNKLRFNPHSMLKIITSIMLWIKLTHNFKYSQSGQTIEHFRSEIWEHTMQTH